MSLIHSFPWGKGNDSVQSKAGSFMNDLMLDYHWWPHSQSSSWSRYNTGSKKCQFLFVKDGEVCHPSLILTRSRSFISHLLTPSSSSTPIPAPTKSESRKERKKIKSSSSPVTSSSSLSSSPSKKHHRSSRTSSAKNNITESSEDEACEKDVRLLLRSNSSFPLSRFSFWDWWTAFIFSLGFLCVLWCFFESLAPSISPLFLYFSLPSLSPLSLPSILTIFPLSFSKTECAWIWVLLPGFPQERRIFWEIMRCFYPLG